jgi:hypothetical protein
MPFRLGREARSLAAWPSGLPGSYLPGAASVLLAYLGSGGKGRSGLDQVSASPQDDPLRQGTGHP